MEEHDRVKPGGSSQDSGCCPLLVPESQEYELERILQESASHLERIPIPDPKPPALPISDLGQPRKSPLTGTDKKYPLMKQRGFYSDILSPGTLDNLGVFDNEEFDCRTPQEWLNMGLEPGSENRKPVPGKALLPTDDVLGHEDPKSQNLDYKWCDVGVLDYDEEKKLYLVQKTDKRGLVRDEMGMPIVNGGVTPKGRPPLLVSQYWVPRIQLLFCAEDPRVFTQRVVQANALRKNTEALLLYNLYVDCMPTEGRRVINEQSLSKIEQWALSTPRMRKGPQ